MVKKRVIVLFFAVIVTALSICSGSEAVIDSEMLPAVFLNAVPGSLTVTKPEPVDLPTFILGGQWTSRQFELYVFTGDGAGAYMGNDGWHTYDAQNPMRPLLSSANYQEMVLPSFVNFTWSPFPDSSGLPEGVMLVSICIDNKLDGVLNPEPESSTCGSVTLNVVKPACILSLSKKAIDQTITEGGNGLQETIIASDNCNSGSFSTTVLEGGDWMSTQVTNGTIVVSFNASGLKTSAQPYPGRIQVTSAGGATDYITASLKVNPKSACTTLTSTPSSVAFHGTVVQLFNIVTVTDSPQTVTIKDCSGNVPANLTLTVDNNSKSWLSATKNPDGSVALVATGAAGTGTHVGTVTASAPGSTSLPIGVTITAGGNTPPPTCTGVNIWPSTLPQFTGTAGQGSDQTQSVSVQDSCGNAKAFSASPSKSWISVTPASGSGSFNVTVTSMPSVTDSGTITVTVGGVAYHVNVTASPTAPACNLPTTPAMTGPGGAIAPDTQYAVNWSTVSDATGYQVCEATNQNFTGQTCADSTSISANYSHTNAACGAAAYYYRVRALNTCGSGNYSAPVTVQVPGTGIPSSARLKDAAGNVISSMSMTLEPNGSYSSIMSVGDDCGATISSFTPTVYAATADGSCTTTPADPWISATKTADSKLSVALSPGNLAAAVYKACVKIDFPGTAATLPSLSLPVAMTVQTTPAVGVTPLVSGVKASDHPIVNPSQSDAYVRIAPHSVQMYSAQQTGTVGAFSLSTKDWATWQDMLIMYSGTTCGSKVPDISDYNSIISLTAPGVQNYSPGGGQMVGAYRFYWAGISSGAPGTSIVGQQNQSLSLISQPTGCYYVLIYNTSDIQGAYALIWQQN